MAMEDVEDRETSFYLGNWYLDDNSANAILKFFQDCAQKKKDVWAQHGKITYAARIRFVCGGGRIVCSHFPGYVPHLMLG
jgi:hypothetical protein